MQSKNGHHHEDGDDESHSLITDAEYGIANHSKGSSSAHTHSSSLLSQRWVYLLCLSLGFIFIAYEISVNTNVKLESTKVVGVMRSKNRNSNYEPLIGKQGELYHELKKDMNYSSRVYDYDDFVGDDDMEFVETNENIENKESSVMSRFDAGDGKVPNNMNQTKDKKVHPRIVCFIMDGINDDGDTFSCKSIDMIKDTKPISELHSIPKPIKSSDDGGKRGGSSTISSSGDYSDLHGSETRLCKLSDPSYQALPAAPSTCNEMHALGFRFGPSAHEPISGVNAVYPSRHLIKYLTSGGFRSVWTVTQLDDTKGVEQRVILKTNLIRKGWGSYYLDQNRRDILISERAGRSPMLFEINTNEQDDTIMSGSNVLPVYQYCAFSSIVPFATAKPLDEYVDARWESGNLMIAEEQYLLAMQAARGVYQMHLYHNGKATHVHADVKPPQFLLFDRPPPEGGSNSGNLLPVPVMQINDFNRGKFLTRNKYNETCPFQLCNVHHKGSLYRSPEEYMDCADQSDSIDVYSLGGVFFFIMSDGSKPWYDVKRYDTAVEKILEGKHSTLPTIAEYDGWDEETMSKLRIRAKHPAVAALKEVMLKCWAFKPEDRPSSLEVVQMLEEKWREIKPSKIKHRGLLSKLSRWTDLLRMDV